MREYAKIGAAMLLGAAAALTAPATADPADGDMWMSVDVTNLDPSTFAQPVHVAPRSLSNARSLGSVEQCFEIGADQRSMRQAQRFRGNVVTVDDIRYLNNIKAELDYTGEVALYWEVLESETADGFFSIVDSRRVVTQMTGRGWYESGDMLLALVPGRYYAIGIGWTDEPIQYYFMETGSAPAAWAYGTVTHGISGGSRGPIDIPTRLVLSSSIYKQQLCFGPTPCDSLNIEITDPADGGVATTGSITVSGTVHFDPFAADNGLDFVFVLDRSGSLTSTDPQNYRSKGAAHLVELLPLDADVQMGVAAFGTTGYLDLGLTDNRAAVSTSLLALPQSGNTAMGEGLQAGLDELLNNGRPDSTKFIILFSDGLHNTGISPIGTNSPTARAAQAGIPIHTLFLGSDSQGIALMKSIAQQTGGTSQAVLNPAELPDLFQNVVSFSKIDRIEVTSSLQPNTILTIPAAEITGDTWSMDFVPVRTTPGLSTTIEARVFTTNYPECIASDLITLHGGTPGR